jgi:hypothetical protein
MAAFSRSINVDMDWLDQDRFEILGQLHDNVHSLAVRFVVGFPDFTIQEARGELTRMPYPGVCNISANALAGFVGEKIGRGFRKRASEIVGGAESCNHLHTLVTDMAICAFQMNYLGTRRRPEAEAALQAVEDDPGGKRQLVMTWMPTLRNSCYTFSEAADALFQIKEREK